MLKQREIDESLNGTGNGTGLMSQQIRELTKWIKSMKVKYPDNKIDIKYHPSYPAISYLRIDSNLFWGPNLCLKQTQQNIGYEYSKNGYGFEYFSKYFNELWDNEDYCIDTIPE